MNHAPRHRVSTRHEIPQSMNTHRYSVMTICAAMIPLLLPEAGLRADGWRDRFLMEGLPSLRELEQLGFWLQATVQQAQTSRGGTERSIRECYYQGPWLIDVEKTEVDWSRIPEKKKKYIPTEFVLGVTSRCRYFLTRTLDGPFTLRRLESIDGKFNTLKIGPCSEFGARSLSAGWVVQGQPFSKWLETEGFSIETVEPVTPTGGKCLVRVKAKYNAVDGLSVVTPIERFTAELLLNPDDHWCICNANYLCHAEKRDISKQLSIEYGQRVDGLPIPSVVTESITIGTNHGTINCVVTNAQKTGTAREDHFAMSRFGVPEVPVGRRQPPVSRFGFWLLGFCILSALITMLLRRYAMKWAKASAR
jgi:hypothetical protein